jgi:hypothetical protein
MAFTPRQKRALDRRTTPTSRQRLADKLRAVNQRASVGPSSTGAKPGLGDPPPKRKAPTGAQRPVGRSSQPDALYYDKVDLAGRQQESRLGQLEGQEQAIKHDFGIEDPTNPFSRAEGLKRMFLQRFRGASAGIAAQGHLYSGQHERALARTRRDEEEARAGLRASFNSAIGQIGAAKAGVKFDTEEDRARAFEDWLARAPESEAPAEAPAEAAGTGGAQAPGAKAGARQSPIDEILAAPQAYADLVNATYPLKPQTPRQKDGPATRRRDGKTEYRWPNGTWHSRPHRGR